MASAGIPTGESSGGGVPGPPPPPPAPGHSQTPGSSLDQCLGLGRDRRGRQAEGIISELLGP